MLKIAGILRTASLRIIARSIKKEGKFAVKHLFTSSNRLLLIGN